MICFDTDKGRFSFRSVAIIIHNDHLLIHRNANDDFWTLPGGRVEFFESAGAAVVREMKEELGLHCRVERQLWQVENFFEFNAQRCHEMAHYFLVTSTQYPEFKLGMDFKGIEVTENMLFRWMPLGEIKNYNLKPHFLIEKIKHLPSTIEAITFNQ